jgi:hypothetical protein
MSGAREDPSLGGGYCAYPEEGEVRVNEELTHSLTHGSITVYNGLVGVVQNWAM